MTFGRRDACVWSPNPLVGFSCKSFLRILLDSSFVVDSVINVLWRTKIPDKVEFSFWQVLLGRVSKLDKLMRKMPSLMDPFCFIHCLKVEKNLDHLLWECPFVSSFWNDLFKERYITGVNEKILFLFVLF